MNRKLKDFLADLITEDKWSVSVLGRLLTSPASSWHAISELCAGTPGALTQYTSLVKKTQAPLMATWLPHPEDGEDTCLVLFYQDSDMSSSVAVVNRARHLELMKDLGSRRRPGHAAAS